jgi:antitoxin HigA-1
VQSPVGFSWPDAGPEDVGIVDHRWEEPMATDMLMSPVCPGEILLAEFLEPLGVSQYQLAKAMDMPTRGINGIVHGQRRISADTASRLARYLGTSKRFWMNLQLRYDIEIEKDWLERS